MKMKANGECYQLKMANGNVSVICNRSVINVAVAAMKSILIQYIE